MGLVFDGTANERMARTANLPSAGGPWTISYWALYDAAPDAFNTHFFVGTDAFSDNYTYLAWRTSTGNWYLEIDQVASQAESATPATATGVWYHFIWVRGAAANRTDIYISRYGTGEDIDYATPRIQITEAQNAPGIMEWGRAGGSSNDGNFEGIICATKWWDVAFNEAQRRREAWCVEPVGNLGDLQGFYPMNYQVLARNDTDLSGLGRDATITGSVAVRDDGPPIVYKARRTQQLFTPVVAAGGGRTTRNTDSHPLGVNHGVSWRMPAHYG